MNLFDLLLLTNLEIIRNQKVIKYYHSMLFSYYLNLFVKLIHLFTKSLPDVSKTERLSLSQLAYHVMEHGHRQRKKKVHNSCCQTYCHTRNKAIADRQEWVTFLIVHYSFVELREKDSLFPSYFFSWTISASTRK